MKCNESDHRSVLDLYDLTQANNMMVSVFVPFLLTFITEKKPKIFLRWFLKLFFNRMIFLRIDQCARAITIIMYH